MAQPHRWQSFADGLQWNCTGCGKTIRACGPDERETDTSVCPASAGSEEPPPASTSTALAPSTNPPPSEASTGHHWQSFADGLQWNCTACGKTSNSGLQETDTSMCPNGKA
ncbi:unnamed protein product [Polarella glacialis]|uniref:Uncharacterized protein n=1 Tax=Polarella glacialis TaxID=89957 RepID=A0A813G979_POLGL|nr:unnamed protein product [Polarella glacialis]CAE8622707.1 unnamed protein product [Polarella glacialis]|mmetsp:Transcript_11356/g.20509  ORF Transcript_11356/g.20509 Transcript_11356/m.20509 type:complete len:111 (+) Transcript_11356:53-385(+)